MDSLVRDPCPAADTVASDRRRLLAILGCATVGSAVAADPEPPWGREARARFAVSLNGKSVGTATQSWALHGTAYRILLELKLRLGLGSERWESRGIVAQTSLKPSHFCTREGRTGVVKRSAEFDYEMNELRQGHAAPTVSSLSTGAQDLLSLPYQLAWGGASRFASIEVTDGRKLRRFEVHEDGVRTESILGASRSVTSMVVSRGTRRLRVWVLKKSAGIPVFYEVAKGDDVYAMTVESIG